jgi:hypothetical protein
VKPVRIRVKRTEEREFWLAVSRPAMDAIWGNEEDDVYEQLLETNRPTDLNTKY